MLGVWFWIYVLKFFGAAEALRLADLRGNIRMLVSLMTRDTRMLAQSLLRIGRAVAVACEGHAPFG
jgi:hypothetical protein